MKVLLLGEFSGLYRYLKEGLLKIGVDVFLAANGDSWKKIDGADTSLYSVNRDKWNIYKTMKNYIIEPYQKAKKLSGYDVVQVINPSIYNRLINKNLTEQVVEQNGLFSLSSAGDDYVIWKAYKKRIFDYYVYDLDHTAQKLYDERNVFNLSRIKYQKRLISKAELIIPCCYEYYKSYTSFPKLKEKTVKTIPLPINCDEIDYRENIVNNKIVIFHGINRELAKGTPFIREALEVISNKYPNDVEVIINKRMPFQEYLEVMHKTNVVIDQCMGYSYGMNSCVAMAEGKVVMAGNHPEIQGELGMVPPVVWIKPDVKHIVSQLEMIIENRNSISEMGYKSRQHVEKYHDHIKVASQYLEAWKSTGKI